MEEDLAQDALDEQVLDRPGEALRAQASVAVATADRRRREAHRLVAETARIYGQLPSTRRGDIAFVLREDPDLARALPPEDLAAAEELFRARTTLVEDPDWTPPDLDPRIAFGLLVLDGLIGRRVSVDGAVALELIGAGDIVRPWDEREPMSSAEWRVFHPARLAILDERITRLISQRSELVVAFSGRLLRRACSAQQLNAISHLPRVEDRVLAALWHLAATWGRVTPAGVVLPFRLTHEVLGEIVGAARPTVTLAMRVLRERGEVRRDASDEYLLTGEAPARYGVD